MKWFQKKKSQAFFLENFSPQMTPWRYDALAEEGYHKNVIVYRCVNLIARAMAGIPWLLFDVKDHPVERHILLDLLHTSFTETLAGHLLLSGNAFIEIAGILKLIRPDRIHIHHKNDIFVYDHVFEGKTRRIPLHPKTGEPALIHIKLFHPLNDCYGMSPLEASSSAIDQHNAVGMHNLSLLQNGGRPSGAFFIKTSTPLTEEQRSRLKHDLQSGYEGTQNAGKLLMLEGDMEWKELGLSPKDLDFSEGKNLSAREIAQAFGVPPMLVGVPGDATFSNYKEARFHLWEDTILPLLELVVNTLNRQLTLLYDVRLSYDTDAIPALWNRREALWKTLSSCSFLTTNEKREALGYGPLESQEFH